MAGCTTCGGNASHITNNVVITNQTNGMNMKEYIESLGWKYIGMCGCSENKAVYTNSTIPNWKIEIAPLALRMEIWQTFSNVDGKKRGIGGPANYVEVYDYWINVERLRLTI